MNNKLISSDKVPRSKSPVAQGVHAQGLVFVGGQMPRDRETGQIVSSAEEQAALSLQYCIDIVEAAGGARADIVLVFAYLTDLSYKPVVDRTFKAVFGESAPARHLVEVSAIGEEAVIEFGAIACPTSVS